MIRIRLHMLLVVLGTAAAGSVLADENWLEFPGNEGPGQGKRIVFVTGDEEYRSEEGMPMLAKILARHHGFHCTVLFAIDKNDGTINPNEITNIPGLEKLAAADLAVIFLRWRDLPDDQLVHLIDYVESGKPVVGLRTATHALKLRADSKYRRYTWDSREEGYDGGLGRQVLGETWISHHGDHGKQSTRGIIAPGAENHPILRGIKSGEIWGPTDVYGVRLPLPGDSQPLVLGQVVEGMKPTDPPAAGPKNDPMMPVAWVKSYTTASGKKARVFTTTMGSSTDLENAPLRRLLVNACYWTLAMDDKITGQANVDLVGEYRPTPFAFNGFKKGVKPADLK